MYSFLHSSIQHLLLIISSSGSHLFFLVTSTNDTHPDAGISNILTTNVKVEQAMAVLYFCNNSKYLSLRDSTIIELIYATGIRASELINIKITDIDFNEATLRILGKGSKERIIPIHDLALNLILKYWKNEIHNHNKLVKNKKIKFIRNLLFLNTYGKKLSRQGLWYIIKNISKKLGLDMNKISPHVLRHTFATHLLYNGVPIRHLQELLGHSNISTTQIYTHLSDQYIESEYSKFSPRVN